MKKFSLMAMAALFGVLLFSFTLKKNSKFENSSKDETSTGYAVGDEAADFRLKNIDGSMVSMSDYKNAKGFIVIFTCNHCPYAVKYENRIKELDKMYKDKGYPVIAINPNDPKLEPDDSFKAMIQRAKDKGFTFPYLMDEGQKVFPKYGATKTPHVFVLNKEGGKNIVRYIGAIDNNYDDPNDVSEYYVRDAVNALLSSQAIKVNKTVAIGCSIKVKK